MNNIGPIDSYWYVFQVKFEAWRCETAYGLSFNNETIISESVSIDIPHWNLPF